MTSYLRDIYKIRRFVYFMVMVMMVFCSTAFAEQKLPDLKAVAKLDSFQGEVSLKHKGLWGTNPVQGMILYHGDKILTGKGDCKVIFNDGAVLTVSPNSNLRIAEFTQEVGAKSEGAFSSTKGQRREIRLLIGKVAYQSGTDKAVETKMISPSAVAALRGTELEFGTNGDTAFIHQISGSSGKEGNISEGTVPDISNAQARNNKEYAASLEANRLRQEYLDAVKALLQSLKLDSYPMYLASADDILNLLIIAQAKTTIKLRADKVLELAAQYSFADATAMILENESLMLNPDPVVKNRAVMALDKCKAALVQAQIAVNNAKEVSKKVDDLIQRITTAKTPEEMNSIKAEFQSSLTEMKSVQTAFNQKAMGKTLVGNEFTSGIDQSRLIEDVETVIVQTAVELIKSEDTEKITVDIVIESAGNEQPGVSVTKTTTETETETTQPETTQPETASPPPPAETTRTDTTETQTSNDKDGDGYTEARGDCDDNDPNRSPGSPEICNDRVDNNCNGMIDEQPCYYGQ